MLITVHKPFHVPYVSLITTSGTIFTKIFLVCPRNESILVTRFFDSKS